MPFARNVTRGSLLKIPQRAERLADAGFLQGRNWTLAQVCEHLMLAIKSTVAGASVDGAPWRAKAALSHRCRRWCWKQATLLTGFIPFGIQAPVIVRPGSELDLPAAVDQLRSAAQSFEETLALPNVCWSDHSILGSMTGSMWRRFHHVHAAHHFNCVESHSPHRASSD